MVEIQNPRKPKKSAIELAVAALDGTPNAMDIDLSATGESPTDLALTSPSKPDNRHAAETGAARGGAKDRALRRRNRPPLGP